MHYRNGDEVPAISLRSLASALRRQALWIVGTALLGVALTVYVVLRQRPVYEAHATLRIEDRPAATQGTDLLTAMNTPSSVETEMEIVRSRTVAESVVVHLGLRARITDPAGASTDSLFGRFEVSADAAPGTYEIWRDTTAYTLRLPNGDLLGGTYGVSLETGGVQLEPLPFASTHGGPVRIVISVMSTSDAAEAIRSALHVSRPQTNAGIVAVAWQSTDRNLAAAVVNDIAQSYIAHRTATQREAYHNAVLFLAHQVDTIGAQLTQSETALEQFRSRNRVIDPTTQAGDELHRVADLQAQHEELSAESTSLFELLRRTRQPAESTADWTDFASTPALVQNSAISAVVGQLMSLEAQRAQLTTQRTAREPEVAGVLRSIGALRARLHDLAQSTLTSVESQLRSVDQSLAQSNVRLSQVPQVELQYARLSRAVDREAAISTLLQTKYQEARISEVSEIANVGLVDDAVVPSTPLGGRRFFNLLFGGALALLCGGLVGLARESSDTRVRSREEIVRLTEVPLLASIPRITLRNGYRKDLAKQLEGRLVLKHAPRSPAAEAYRALRTNVSFAGNGRGDKAPLRTLVVTSPEPEDGKSTTAANLAVTLGEQGHRVILIGADQRRPVLYKVLHTARAPGLSDLLGGTAPLEQAVRDIPLPEPVEGTFAFIPAGSPVQNPAELLGGAAMRELLVLLRERYDTVVIDTPPLCVVTDAAVLGAIADGVIIVARMGVTHGEALQRAVEEMQALGARVVGTVLTDVSQREDRYGYRYGYYTYYDEDGKNGHNGHNGHTPAPQNRIKQHVK
jgi:capsular exopolysaccharide synthesis family protein